MTDLPPPVPLPTDSGWTPEAHPLGPPWTSRRSNRSLRRVTITLFWVTTAASALVFAATTYRRSLWNGLRSGDAELGDLDTADDIVAFAVIAQIVLGLATVIVLSIWTFRAARNADRVGAFVSPRWACGGWYIPIANLVVPFVQLRRILNHGRRPTTPVSLWQTFIVVSAVVSGPLGNLGDTESASTASDLSSRLSYQVGFAGISVLLLAATSIVAAHATREVDAVAGPDPAAV